MILRDLDSEISTRFLISRSAARKSSIDNRLHTTILLISRFLYIFLTLNQEYIEEYRMVSKKRSNPLSNKGLQHSLIIILFVVEIPESNPLAINTCVTKNLRF
jgi:hypothetical protein